MLFEIIDDYSKLKPTKFHTFSDVARTEKQLEELLAQHLFEVLFFHKPLLPFHQERPYQPVADIYALNEHGDIVIIELKRDVAYTGALDQLLRYAGEAGLWSYKEIESKYRPYSGADTSLSLIEAHANAFELEQDRMLRENEFNRQQHLWVVGNAADDGLIRRIDYWKSKGLSIDFFPYRVYQINDRIFLEFFSKPYDYHLNPADHKGVLFDTNGSHDHEDGYGCLREMFAESKISAYGNRKEAIFCLQPNDYVFYYQVGKGVVGAAKVKGQNVQKVKHPEHGDEWYWVVEVLTPTPEDVTKISALSVSEVESLLGKGFYWARIDKRPHLSIDESEVLLKQLLAQY